MTSSPFEPLSFARGPAMPNRFMLAPLTNEQSHDDGTMSEDEFRFLTMRAQGGFGLTMTCAAHVQPSGQCFPGQLGAFDDRLLPGLERLAAAINAEGGLSAMQLHHGGRRARADLIGEAARCPWDDAETGARALSTGEVEQLVEDFILAGLRAQAAGFHGVELHGAHGYLLCQFLDADNNRREDRYGGEFQNRTRVLRETVAGLRERAGPDFQIGVRLSPERFGVQMAEARRLAQELMTSGLIDYLDMSLWDVFKTPVEEAYRDRQLVDWFTDLPRGDCRLGAAGKLMTAAEVREAMARGLDFVLLGRAAILHHDFPRRMQADAAFASVERPVSRAHLRAEGLGEAFLRYMGNWKGFVAD